MRAPKHGRGVTLVELSTTLAAATIILTLGIPAFQGLRTDMQRSQVGSALVETFALARSEALRRGVAVSLCPSSDGRTCTSGPGADWNTGWIVTAAEGRTTQVLEATRFDESSSFSLAADQSLAGGVTFSRTGLPGATGAFTYSDGTTRSVYRLIPIGRLELGP